MDALLDSIHACMQSIKCLNFICMHVGQVQMLYYTVHNGLEQAKLKGYIYKQPHPC